MKVKCNLKITLWEKKMDQKDLADAVGVSRATISMWVNGKGEPDISKAYEIAAVLGVSVYDIWQIKESDSP